MEGYTLAQPATQILNGHPMRSGASAGPGKVPISLCLLGKFDLTIGDRSIPVGLTSQRLLTLVAIRSGHVPRGQAAGILWPDSRGARAAANLRSALWRLQQCCNGVLDASFYDLRFAPGVLVDIHHVSRIAVGLLDRSAEVGTDELKEAMRCNLYDDIASEIGDDGWLMSERERFRQLRVHALEAMASWLIAAGWHGAAVEAVLGAIRADPFRESAYQLLIRAHLAEGSRLEACRQHRVYCDLLRTELGLTPSDEFMELLDGDVPSLPTQKDGRYRPL